MMGGSKYEVQQAYDKICQHVWHREVNRAAFPIQFARVDFKEN